MAAQVLPVSSQPGGNFRDSSFTRRHTPSPQPTPTIAPPHKTPPLQHTSLPEVRERLSQSISDDLDLSFDVLISISDCEDPSEEHHSTTSDTLETCDTADGSQMTHTTPNPTPILTTNTSITHNDDTEYDNNYTELNTNNNNNNNNTTFQNSNNHSNNTNNHNSLMSDSGIGATFSADLKIDDSDLNKDTSDVTSSTSSSPLASPSMPLAHPETPDSGFSGLVTSTPALETPEEAELTFDPILTTPEEAELTFDPILTTPVTSSGEGPTRKRKHVNFDESQTSIVVISPGDLFRAYSRQEEDEEASSPLLPNYCETEAIQRQLVDLDPSPDLDLSRYVLDPNTGWPLKRSESLESRDNPFLAGGDLSREAEDLLSRATIIRDKFIIQDEAKALLDSTPQATETTPPHTDSAPVVEECVSPTTAGANFSSAPPSTTGVPRANGKAGDSPGDVTDSIPTQPTNGAQAGGALIVQDSEEKKRGKKCCSLM